MSGYIGTQPVPQATQTRDSFTCTAGQTSFATSGYTPNFLDVYLNGVKLTATDYTASNGSDVVLASGAATGDVLEVVAYTPFEAANVTGADDFTVTGNLSVDGGTIKLDGNYPVGTANVALGDNALSSGSLSGGYNIAIGGNALASNTTGVTNVAIGAYAIADATTASRNIGIGEGALRFTTSGGSNIAIGDDVMSANTTGTNNVALGDSALENNTTASNNTAVGYQAGYANTTGQENVFIGRVAGYATTNSYNTAVGDAALYSNTSGGTNTAIGKSALQNNTTGYGVAALGWEALYSNTTGAFNTALGRQSLRANTTASYNTAVGYRAGYANTTGADNTFIGTFAGEFTTGPSNTFIGTNAGYAVTTGQKNTILGKYTGNQGGLDIRTSSNNIVLSDGDGNPRIDINGNGGVLVGRNSNGNNTFQHYRAASTAGFAIIEGKSNNHGTNTTAYYFRADGGLANYSANNVNLSDERVKTDIVDAPDYLDKLCQIPVRTFKYSNEADATDNVGVIAQEVEAIIPELVDAAGWGDEVPADGVPLKSVYDTDIQYVMMKCIQELKAKNDALEARITALENA